ncbi:terminase large subunit domain-containing protein [Lysobacter enzymogenes]|uniref:terminase large subunit domain-containing protein n=1 Tax=Lysobacter enzymogenes TaxID=69 RepID=UPI001A97A415|nr:terminase family protein [Lysobacter enzymogenes]QQP97932.1 hypothetical protein JHW38_07995 [Lysobacter enzymogenes]
MSSKRARAYIAESWRHDPAQMMRDAGFEPDPHQLRLLESQEQNELVLWPRQQGKSRAIATRVLHCAYFTPGDIVILAGEKQKQAREVFDRACDMHNTLRELGDVPEFNIVGDEATLENKSRILALPSTVESIRGYSAKLAVVDEAAFTEDGTLKKVTPMLSMTNGRLIASSTPNGAAGWFHDAWHGQAVVDDDDDEPLDWFRHMVTVDQILAYEKPRLTRKELKRQRLAMTPIEYRQEWLLEWLDGEQQFFPTEVIKGAVRDDIIPLFKRLETA